jgi:hypothetical protein
VIEQLGDELARRQIGPKTELPDDSPHQPLVTAARYLNNHRQRMDYPRYRCEGLPITSAPMESLVRQINHRVSGEVHSVGIGLRARKSRGTGTNHPIRIKRRREGIHVH